MDKSNKVLIVDDSEINRSLLADMLSADYSLLEASNGLEAMVLINQYHSELSMVLLDIVMPEMDGFEVLASMNGAGLLERLPVIMISAETSSAYIDHAYELGAAEYISRPFDEQTVKRRVKNTITLYSKQKTLENLVTEQILEKEKSNLVMIEILSHIVEFRNGESGLHVLHIRIITEALLKQLAKRTNRYNLNAKQINLISNVSALHDIGEDFHTGGDFKQAGQTDAGGIRNYQDPQRYRGPRCWKTCLITRMRNWCVWRGISAAGIMRDMTGAGIRMA